VAFGLFWVFPGIADQPPALSIGSSELGFSVESEAGVLVPTKTIEWNGRRRLRKDADLFRNWTLLRGQDKRLVDDWRKHLDGVGDRILNEVFPPDCLETLQPWARKLDAQGSIHYRFKVDDDDLMHLPFELMRHPTRDHRLRDVSPVCREIALGRLDLLRSYASGAGGKPKVLCIVSNVRGTLAIQNFEFGRNRGRHSQSARTLGKFSIPNATVPGDRRRGQGARSPSC
jgi:hypothetical protein